LEALTCILAQDTGRELLKSAGISVEPGSTEVTWNTNPDDPPDITAFGCGFEITEFPPDNAALMADTMQRFQKGLPTGGAVPAFSKTKGDIRVIRKERDDPMSVTNNPYSFTRYADEILALEETFNSLRANKDVHGNDVLLLDSRRLFVMGRVVDAVERALVNQPPVYWRLVLIFDMERCIKLFAR
jgi:hypothetical protein